MAATIEQELASANARVAELESQIAAATPVANELRAANDLLTEAQASLTTAQADVARLTGELTTVRGELSAATVNLSAVIGERDNFRAAINEGGRFEFVAGAAKPTLTLTATGKQHFVAATIAQFGHAPLAIGGGVDTAAGAKAGTDQLTARDRAVAATNAQPAVAAYSESHNLRK